jgi:hypothetical protein
LKTSPFFFGGPVSFWIFAGLEACLGFCSFSGGSVLEGMRVFAQPSFGDFELLVLACQLCGSFRKICAGLRFFLAVGSRYCQHTWFWEFDSG